ncbi:malonyl CoA-acyl carrier protein transacylase [Lysinibacillus alkalisoli]|uniref:Malonyl CoA-acyl carrier protein transacylase n=1 Tax=Lysinibacillus alkalisoli TaxID=1911548 RepID=A0A917G438_9BACI|nr:ACP S-malonyltransferase [Lysinibacillus alkalisoli]GGG21505.1 malonyl CoA-acyl carrier protein transacylase [Lysinibacillus alkalisoli]
MATIAFIFPGQGSQSVGMGQEFVIQHEDSNQFYEQANTVLAYDLKKLMLEGPQEELTLTFNAQPALLTTGVMVAERIKKAGIQPQFVAGHSLGEYSALVIAGVMSFTDAVQAVHKRGLFMEEAVPAGEGAMAAILGMAQEPLAAVTTQITNEGYPVQLANLNCPGQIVISGTKEGVEQACVLAKAQGAKRAIPLVVSGPFHSSLMAPAAQKLAEVLMPMSIHDAKTPVIANVTAQSITAADAIRTELIDQVCSPVRWEESVREMIAQGVDVFIECGPGKVLSGLVKKVDRSVKTYCVYDEASLQAFLEASKEWV